MCCSQYMRKWYAAKILYHIFLVLYKSITKSVYLVTDEKTTRVSACYGFGSRWCSLMQLVKVRRLSLKFSYISLRRVTSP